MWIIGVVVVEETGGFWAGESRTGAGEGERPARYHKCNIPASAVSLNPFRPFGCDPSKWVEE